MTALHRHTIPIRPGLSLDMHTGGEGSPLLLLHGGPGPTSVAALGEHLASHHRVVMPTHPGWDGTERPDDLDSVQALAAVYLELLDHLELNQVTVVGTSFGGWVATQIALDDREGRLSRLVLMDAIGPAVPGQQVTAPTPPPAAGPGSPAGHPSGEEGPAVRTMAAMRAYTGPNLHDPEMLPRLGTVALPVLVLWGGEDTVVTPDFGRAYAAAFPHARFELIPGAGHLPLREEPEAVFTHLDTFLAAHRTAGP